MSYLNAYLLSLEVCGIKNIEQPIRFDFYKKTIKNDFDPTNYRVKAIYGENGSGKTAVITAVKILQNLIYNTNYLSDSNSHRKVFEAINKKTKSAQLCCEYSYDLGDHTMIGKYEIGLGIKSNRVYITNEKLSDKVGNYSKNPYEVVYQVEDGELVDLMQYDRLFENYREKTLNVISQQSFAASIIRAVSAKDSDVFLTYIAPLILLSLSMMVYLDESDSHDTYLLREEMKMLDDNNGDFNDKRFRRLFERIINTGRIEDGLVKKSDIKGLKSDIKRMAAFLKIFKSGLNDIEVETKDYGEYYKYNLVMQYDDYPIDSEFESRGIKKLMRLFEYLDAACRGYIVFIDELDSNINDIYLGKVIEYFALYGKGQLCFTAHNLSPMAVLKNYKNSINFLSEINTVHTWVKKGNQSPENAYRNGFIEDSPFNVDATDFLGILGDLGTDE